MRQFFVYILANKSRRLYVGITNNLERRVYDHLSGSQTFTAQYRINRLVYFEEFKHPLQAIIREKQLKSWVRRRKIPLIEARNPAWANMAEGWFEPCSSADP